MSPPASPSGAAARRFDGQVALVAGGAGGIGAETCRLLAELGAIVWVLDQHSTAADDVIGQIRVDGGICYACRADATDRAEVHRAVADVVRTSGRLDVLVNTIGWTMTRPFIEEDEEYWQTVVAVNLLAHIYLCHAVLGPMAARGYGRIVGVSSDAGRVGTRGETVYAAAKAAVIGFTKSLAREVARHGILVNAVSPGPTRTPLLDHQDQNAVAAMIRHIPVRRLGTASEQAAAITFLASPAASFITGQVLSVSGGLTMVD
ncbi:MAG: SDR family oxidoreductase [Micromonosporaceae bacterium]|nr:SDR family oxidoreductase [Micromonosporaceae bacterium]